MDNINLALAIHFHQPTGNFDNIFERAYDFCYKPFLELLSKYPDIKMMFHFSGCLLDYLDEKHPEAIKLIKRMASDGQLEIMGGAYYEPILTAIPEKDALGQIKMFSSYIKERFGREPKGMWLAERVWHPELAKTISRAGIKYLILDDEHLLRSGVEHDKIHGYFETGRGAEKLAVFPSDKNLRYMIPFKMPEETLNYLKGIAERKKGVLLTYGDDGEKFGEWPGTHKWVFEEKWLAKFFDILKQNKKWIKLAHFSDYLKKNGPTASLAIKEGSYEEMLEWTGGPWMNFLSKYPESNQMHKKMLYVSAKLEKLENYPPPHCLGQPLLSNAGVGSSPRNDGVMKQLEKARKELYEGQCNCAYWHGVFGGLYLYHLRKAVYEHLIKADKELDSILHAGKKGWREVRRADFMKDGRKLLIMESPEFSLCIDPEKGGIIKELDYRPMPFNIINTLSRKKESYHQKILDSAEAEKGAKVATIHDDFRTVDPAFKNMLIYDKFGRYFLRSYFLKSDLGLQDFASSKYEEEGDFSTAAYEAGKKVRRVTLKRESSVAKAKVALTKEIGIVSPQEIKIACSLAKKGAAPAGANGRSPLLFALEFNITMPDLNSDRYKYRSDKEILGDLNTEGECSPRSSFGISDSLKEFGIRFAFSKPPASTWYFPVKTVSQSERSYELNYQCSCLVFLWRPFSGKNNTSDFAINLILGKAAYA